MLDFEWDFNKASLNYKKHGITFEYAARVFLDKKAIILEDLRKNYGENRFIVLGLIDKRLYVVVYSLRGKKIRIIPARKGDKREQKKYSSF